MFFFLTQFVQNILGFSPLKAGLSFLPLSAGIVVAATVMSRVIGRVGPRLPMTIAPLVTAGGLLWLSRLSVHSNYVTGILAPLMLIAVSMGSIFVPLTLTAVQGVRRDEAGLASALLNTGQQVGGSLGLAILVTVATTATGAQHHVSRAVAVTAGYHSAFMVAAGIAAFAFFLALVSIRTQKSEPALSVADEATAVTANIEQPDSLDGVRLEPALEATGSG
jgi:predicted MFS family arabinose efflux permease